MADITIQATLREVIGKQVKQLRREGKVPGVIYGPNMQPKSLLFDGMELKHVLREAGGTNIIELRIDGESHHTLVREVQRDPIKGDILHVDFYEVALDRAIRAEIPVVLVGESPAITSREGVLIHATTSVEVEALPTDLVNEIEVDMTALKEVGDMLLVGDLQVPKTIRILTDPDEMVVKIEYMLEEEEEEEVLVVEPSAEEVEVIGKGKEAEAEGEEEEESE
jgi:large subunit ribosomal protein L25